MKRVHLRRPNIQVILKKNVGRSTTDGATPVSERFKGQNRNVDLARFLGDQGSVTVKKSVREPAGCFTLVLTDQIDIAAQDSMYGLIEPMDIIEIRMAGDAYKYTDQLPVMMRGFVTTVSRFQGMGPDGKPQRRVVVTGHDYGKIWQTYQIFTLPNSPDISALIGNFPFFVRFGVDFRTLPAGEFVRQVLGRVLNPYLVSMGAQSGNTESPLVEIKDGIDVDSGSIDPFGLGGWNTGTIYGLFQQYCDVGQWNEIFVEDREDAPYLVYRPNPFRSADGKGFIQPLTTQPSFIEITREDVVSLESARTDRDVANYYWTDAPAYNLNSDPVTKLEATRGAPDSFYLRGPGNSNPALYGPRKMWEQTQQSGEGEIAGGNGTPDGADRQQGKATRLAWIDKRRAQLIAQNKDNVVFEQGSMKLKGNERIRAGNYVRLASGNMVSDYYAFDVQHDYRIFQPYTTTVLFERGTGFIDRVQKGGGRAGPYYSELADNE